MTALRFLALISAVWMGLAWLFCYVPPAKTQQTHTDEAFNHWASDCKPDDLHYGQTNDGAGQRAFIVTCTAKEAH